MRKMQGKQKFHGDPYFLQKVVLNENKPHSKMNENKNQISF
jgi:hypothetical protein